MNIPSSIDEALRDEACVETALSILKEARAGQAAQLEAMRETRAPFNLLVSLARKKPETPEAIHDAEERLAKTDEAIIRTETIRARLDAEVRSLLEEQLRATDGAHARALDSADRAGEWLRTLDIYEKLLRSYLADLGRAREAAGAARHKKAGKAGDAAAPLASALENATALDGEAIIINRLALEHGKCVSGTPLEDAALPAVPQHPHCEWTRRLQHTGAGSLQAQCDLIIKTCEAFAGSDIPRLREAGEGCISRAREFCSRRVLDELDVLRRRARSQNMNFEKLEERIASIEIRFA